MNINSHLRTRKGGSMLLNNQLPASDIPNFSAAFGKSPRSIIPKDKFLFEYLHTKTFMHKNEGKKKKLTISQLKLFG